MSAGADYGGLENPELVYAQNVRIVALKLVQSAIEKIDWEDFPDLAERDFEAVYKVAQEWLAPWPPWPSWESYRTAYEWLAVRAEGTHSDAPSAR